MHSFGLRPNFGPSAIELSSHVGLLRNQFLTSECMNIFELAGGFGDFGARLSAARDRSDTECVA